MNVIIFMIYYRKLSFNSKLNLAKVYKIYLFYDEHIQLTIIKNKKTFKDFITIN